MSSLTAEALEKRVNEYVADYETLYDEAAYTPDDEEKFRIKDAILGFLASEEEATKPVTAAWCEAYPASAASIMNILAAQADATDEGLRRLCQLIEAIPASSEQTTASLAASNLLHDRGAA